MTNKDRYLAVLLGCAIGDSLGMPVEGWRREHIRKYVGRVEDLISPVIIKDAKGEIVREDEFGKLKYYTRDLEKGEYTDDTLLTLAIAKSIANKGALDLVDICKEQVEIYKSRKQENGHIRGGFGRTTKDAFERLLAGISPYESGMSPGLGNGTCMKMAPLGIYMDATGDLLKGKIMSKMISLSTHLDPRAVTSGIVQAQAIYSLLSDESRDEFLSSLTFTSDWEEGSLDDAVTLQEKGTLTEKLYWIQENKDIDSEKAFRILGNSSLAIDSYPFSVFMFQKYWDEPIEGLIETINFGGDCDTTGAMYGALAGAKNGLIFPQKWVEGIKRTENFEEIAEKLSRLK